MIRSNLGYGDNYGIYYFNRALKNETPGRSQQLISNKDKTIFPASRAQVIKIRPCPSFYLHEKS